MGLHKMHKYVTGFNVQLCKNHCNYISYCFKYKKVNIKTEVVCGDLSSDFR
jgi:hypothetical protein